MTAPVYLLTLHKTYYDKGFFNLGVDVDRYVKSDGGAAVLLAGDAKVPFRVEINRTASTNGTPRVMGGVEVRNWIQNNLRSGDVVEVHILAPDRFWLRRK